MFCFILNLNFIINVIRLCRLLKKGENKIKIMKKPNDSVLEQIAEEEIKFGRKVH